MIDREELVAELAKAHGIRIDPDDPVLTAAFLNRRLLDEAIARFEAAVRTSADRLTEATVQQVNGAQETAALLVTRAGEWSAERLKGAAAEASAIMLADVRREAARAEQASRMAIRAAWIIAGVSAVAMAGAAGFVLADFQLG